jgi:L-serine dehydratase
MYEYNTAAELLALCKKHRVKISEIAIRYEMEHSSKHRREVLLKMRRVKSVMKNAVLKPLKSNKKSSFGMVGGDAKKLMEALQKKKMAMSKLAIKAMAYASATGETNAMMGKISAFPTAGGSGVIPGVTLSATEHWGLSEQKFLKGLFTAAAVGKIIAENATLSAAAGGCQAEVGAAVAMAAAAVTEMRGGSPEEAFNASALALKSYLGLACDPLGGLVAVPCVRRNLLGASMALAASDAAIAGVKSFVPFDDVIKAMKSIAQEMPSTLRETSLGGLAITETGLRIRKKVGLPPLQ